MTFILQSRPQTVAALVAFAAMVVVGFVPLFGGPGYESALAAGVLLPTLAAVATALDVVRERPEPFDALSRGIASGAVLSGVAYATTLLHGVRVGFCDPLGGSIAFALGPALGAVTGGVWGAAGGALAFQLAARRMSRCAMAIVFALIGPWGGIALSLWRFYSSPMVFAFDPFFGYFSGTLYDTVVDATTTLLTYRAGSALTLGAAALLALQFTYDEAGRLAPRHLERPGLWLLAAACATASFLVTAEGWRLGHWQTSSTITTELGAQLGGSRCDVVYPRALSADQARRFARDCDEQLAADERYFGVPEIGRVTVFLFSNAAEKRRLMGAADTLIAKPWRREVYVQVAGYPHPVLGHELAHVVAGTFGRGPFRIAGGMNGWKPNPGLIEGVAVAASPGEDELTPAEWSRAMLDLKILPPLSSIFALGFLGENAAKSYTVAGAFIDWLQKKLGSEAIRRWYGGEPIDTIANAPLAKLEAEWHEFLSRLPVPDKSKAIARARFDRPSVFGRRCPHRVDLFFKEASTAEGKGDFVDAARQYDALLKLDPRDAAARYQLANCYLRRGDVEEATKRLDALADDESAPRNARDWALGELADLAMEDGNTDAAAQRYRELAQRTLDEDALRTIEIKSSSLADARARRAIAALLIGEPTHGPDPIEATALLGTWIGEDPTDGLPEYLVARQFLNRGEYTLAAERLDRALSKRLPPGAVLREALRLRVVVGCALGDLPAARKAYEIWSDRGSEPSTARKESLRRLIDRCAKGDAKAIGAK